MQDLFKGLECSWDATSGADLREYLRRRQALPFPSHCFCLQYLLYFRGNSFRAWLDVAFIWEKEPKDIDFENQLHYKVGQQVFPRKSFMGIGTMNVLSGSDSGCLLSKYRLHRDNE